MDSPTQMTMTDFLGSNGVCETPAARAEYLTEKLIPTPGAPFPERSLSLQDNSICGSTVVNGEVSAAAKVKQYALCSELCKLK